MARRGFTAEEKRLRQQYSLTSRRIRQQMKRLTEKHPNNTMKDYYSGEFPYLKDVGNISIRGLKLLNKRATQVYRSQLLTSRKYETTLLKSLNTLKKVPEYSFLNEGNIEDMWRFIDDIRARGLADIYGYNYFIGLHNRITKGGKNVDIKKTLDEWTKYASSYEARKGEAMKAGREVRPPKRLRYVKAGKGSSNI